MARKAFTRIFQKTVCVTVSASLLALPFSAYGVPQEVISTGFDAQSFALDHAQEYSNNLPVLHGENLTVPLHNGKAVEFEYNDLVPNNKTNPKVKYHFENSSIERLASLYDDPTRMDDEGVERKKGLFQDAESDDPSIEGHVYAIMKDMTNRTRLDMSSDAVFESSYKVIDNLTEIAEGLGNCEADTQLLKEKRVQHMPKYEVCTQVIDRSGTCKIRHQYRAGVMQHYDGPYNLKACGEGCTQVWIGKVGDNYWRGRCSIYEEWTQVIVTNPDAIVKATLNYAKWDDYMQVFVGPPGQEERVWTGPYDWRTHPDTYFPPETKGRCELSTSWSRNLDVDVTDYFKKVKKGSVVSFKIKASVTGGGEGFGRIKVEYDPAKAVKDDSWYPPSCVEAAHGVEDGFANGDVRCTKLPPLDREGCSMIDGVRVCPHHLNKTPISEVSRVNNRLKKQKAISPLCMEVTVNSDFHFYKGKMDCYTDINGKEQCPENVGGVLDECEEYEKNPKCSFVKSQCTEGATGKSGTCYVNDVTYDCGEDVEVVDTKANTKYDCPGDIACMGGECIDTTKTVSTSFAQVTALLNAVQHMTEDMTCTGIDDEGHAIGDRNVTCSVFGGEASECKKAVGGTANCCKSVPGGVGVGGYLTMIKTVADLNSAANDLAADKNATGVMKDVAGQWVSLKGEAAEAVRDGMDYICSDFSTYVDNITGWAEGVQKAISETIDAFIDELKKKCTEMLSSILEKAGVSMGEAAGSGGASEAATLMSDAATDAAATVMSALSVVSWVYTAYCVAKMAIQMIYACEEEEYAMIAKRDVGSCHFVGSYCRNKKLGVCIEKREAYCCFKSPLARIINEQVRLQGDNLGVEFNGFGTAKQPICTGIPMDKIADIDWDRVDLSEWVAILEANHQLADEDSLTLEKLTGAGSKLDIDGKRLNTIERTYQRLEGVNIDGVRTEAGKRSSVDVGYQPK